MKKLLGTTALVAAAFATAPAMAADKINIKVGGYFVGSIAAVFDNDAGEGVTRGAVPAPVTLPGGQDQRTIRFGREAEIHFKGSTTLDNGVEVGVKFELESGESAGDDTVDEAYLWVSGAFGEFQFGAQDGVGDQMPIVAPSPFLETFANDTDLDPLGAGDNRGNGLFSNTAAAPIAAGGNPTGGAGASVQSGNDGVINTVVDLSGDSDKIIYFTPRLAGFQIGLSFAPEIEELSGDESFGDSLSGNNTLENVFEAGITWEYAFNGVDLGVSGVYANAEGGTVNTFVGGVSTFNNAAPDISDWAVGASVGFAGFTVGGAYANKESMGSQFGVGTTSPRLLEDYTAWDVGVTYGTGPWTFGVEYAEANRDESRNPVTNARNFDEVDLSAIVTGVAYSLGGGANVTLGYKYAEDEAVNREGSALFTEFGVKF